MLLQLTKRISVLLLPLLLLTACGGIEWFTFEDEEDLVSYDKRRAPRDNSFILEGGLSKKAKYKNMPVKTMQKTKVANQKMRNPNLSKSKAENNIQQAPQKYRRQTQNPTGINKQEAADMDDFFENLSVKPQAGNSSSPSNIGRGGGNYLNHNASVVAYTNQTTGYQNGMHGYDDETPGAAVTYVEPRKSTTKKPGMISRSLRSVGNGIGSFSKGVVNVSKKAASSVGSLFGFKKKEKTEGYEVVDYRIPKVTSEKKYSKITAQYTANYDER
jgi:hypothetical protein